MNDETVPMYFSMHIDREGPCTTRYTFQLNDLGATLYVADWEHDAATLDNPMRDHARSILTKRATRTEEVLWDAVLRTRPVYYERARALGWHEHRPKKGSR